MQIQLLLGARDGHVEQAALLFQVRDPLTGERQYPLIAVGHKHDGPFQPLGLMNGGQRHRIEVRLLPDFLFGQLTDVLQEFQQRPASARVVDEGRHAQRPSFTGLRKTAVVAQKRLKFQPLVQRFQDIVSRLIETRAQPIQVFGQRRQRISQAIAFLHHSCLLQ